MIDTLLDNKLYRNQILKWSFIGLVLRLILMPFTMHGQDLFFINYFPMKFVTSGVWDVYGFISTNFSHFPATYYGPVLFIITSIANFIFIKFFNVISLVKILEISSTMMFKHFTTVDYVYAFSQLDLFKNLFLMKIPYLIFDFLIGAILLKLALSKRLALNSYKLWMLNIVALQSAYAVGGAHLIQAFFIMIALFAAVRRRPYLCVILLSLGGATQMFPYVLILPTSLLLGRDWKSRFLLCLTAVLVSVLVYLPFYLSSGDSIFGLFTLIRRAQYSRFISSILLGIFSVPYIFILLNSIKDSRAPRPEKNLLYYFTIIIFLSYATFSPRFRYFLSITPLLALIIPQYKKFGIFIFSIIFMLAFMWLTQRDLQLGLFAPLSPEYFSNLPTIQEVLSRFINMEIVYKIIARISSLTFFVAGWWVWRIKLNRKIDTKAI